MRTAVQPAVEPILDGPVTTPRQAEGWLMNFSHCNEHPAWALWAAMKLLAYSAQHLERPVFVHREPTVFAPVVLAFVTKPVHDCLEDIVGSETAQSMVVIAIDAVPGTVFSTAKSTRACRLISRLVAQAPSLN